MSYLVIFLLFAVVLLFWLALTMPPKKGARLLMNGGPILLMGVGGLLTLLQRGIIGIPMVLVGFSWWKRAQNMGNPLSTPGRTSKVSSIYLEMELDHETGEMDGIALGGRFDGARLSTLTEDELFSLYKDIAGDGDSIALLGSFLDRYHGDWRNRSHDHFNGSSEGGTGFEQMTKEEAYQILGLEPGATKEEIHNAWRRLMKAVHPDSGGSDFLAAKINAAKDLLLG